MSYNNIKQKGGILVNTKDSEAFKNFLSNCTLKFLSAGANGVTFVAQIKPDTPLSKINYRHMYLTNFGKPVETLLIKLCFLKSPDQIKVKPTKKDPSSQNSDDSDDDDEIEIPSINRLMNKALTTDFIDEVNNQTVIFFKSMNYLQPICPAPVYSEIHTNPNPILLLIKNKAADERTRKILNEVYTNFQNGNLDIVGLLAMEFAQDYNLLYNFRGDPKFRIYETMAAYLLIRLAVETGYTQSDFHMGNIMINPNSQVYFKGVRGSPLLIDFGYARKISEPIMKEIKAYYEEGNYTEILKLLCTIDRPDGIKMTDYLKHYGWACGLYDVVSDKKTEGLTHDHLVFIDKFFKRRELALDHIKYFFDKLHDNNPKKYPLLLPLSNSIKNNLYNGMITGGGNVKIWKNKKTNRVNHSKNRKTRRNYH